jgi:1-aminocyclopropane-1-carboxylate deaminase/D-cysteine desulfhydrase-like pyridoxal-dependent ACC family enzyme
MMTVEQLRQAMARLPRVELAVLPTPVHPCPRLSRELGIELAIKRDDLTGLAFGGNKTRKFDFVFGDALAQGADTVVGGFGSQSNFSRQAAAAAAKLGLRCYIVSRHDQRARTVGIQGNYLLQLVLGAQVRLVPAEQLAQARRQAAEELRAQGHRPYILNDTEGVLGAVAYAGCVAELVEQGQAPPDYIVLASGTGTQPGIVLGVRALGLPTRVIGFRPGWTADDQVLPEMTRIANEAAARLGLALEFGPQDFENSGAYVGEAYGIPTPAGLDAIERLARTEGILLDPVYTGKAFAGLLDYVRTGRIPAGSRVVFLHTGGQPALFAYAPELIAHGGYEMVVVEDIRQGIYGPAGPHSAAL